MKSKKNLRKIEVIEAEDLNPLEFIKEKVKEIRNKVGKNDAVIALSGGIDSSVTAAIAHTALKDRLKVYFIDTGLMRENEPENISSLFDEKMDMPVLLIKAENYFFASLKGIVDPEEKRKAITETFYKGIFGPVLKNAGIKYLLQGTNYTDVEETTAGIKRQHNVLSQLGINPEKEFGYKVLEPLVQLRKEGIRMLARELRLPNEITERMPFPGPALAVRIIGEVTREKTAIIRKATSIVEEEFSDVKTAFQYLAILHQDKVTGIKDGKRKLGNQIEIRCWDSANGVVAGPTELPYVKLKIVSRRITDEIPEVVSVTYNISDKPPSTIEAE